MARIASPRRRARAGAPATPRLAAGRVRPRPLALLALVAGAALWLALRLWLALVTMG